MERFQVRQDEAFARVVTLRGLDGRALANTYAGTETFSASLMAGDSRAVVATLAATWEDSDAGEVLVSLDAGDVSGLARGVYRARLLILDGGDPYPAWEADVEVLAAPGDDAAPLIYGTYDGMLRKGGDWLPKLSGEASQSAYVEELHEAVQWTHRNVVDRARAYLDRYTGGYLGDVETVDLLAAVVDATGDTSAALWSSRLGIIETALATGTALTISDTIKSANEHYAVGMVLRRPMPSKDSGDHFASMAAWHESRANRLLGMATFVVSVTLEDETVAVFSIGPI